MSKTTTAAEIILGIGGVLVAGAAIWGAVKLTMAGHPVAGFLVGAGGGLAGTGLAVRALRGGDLPGERALERELEDYQERTETVH